MSKKRRSSIRIVSENKQIKKKKHKSTGEKEAEIVCFHLVKGEPLSAYNVTTHNIVPSSPGARERRRHRARLQIESDYIYLHFSILTLNRSKLQKIKNVKN